MQNFGKTRKVSTKYQGRIGAPPPASSAAQASAARYEGSAKQRRDLAVQAAKAGERPRSTGRVKRQTFTPSSTYPGRRWRWRWSSGRCRRSGLVDEPVALGCCFGSAFGSQKA